MNCESRPLLLLLAVAASSSPALSTEARATSPPVLNDSSDVLNALRAVARQKLASFVIGTERPPQPGTQTVQFYNFPQFPNYFYNCIRGYWRNC